MTSQLVRARVWHTGELRVRGRHGWNGLTWHYEVTCGNAVILYDNTGSFDKTLTTALIEVTALRHMVIAGHKLKPYKGFRY